MSEQGTQEWRDARAGCITASRFADAIAMSKTKAGQPTAARDTYMRELVAEILSGQPKHEISSKSLQWGRDNEPVARDLYELRTGEFVEQCGFLLHPDYAFIGASPDGLCGDEGGIEMKCPLDEQVHIKTLLEGMPPDHVAQVQGGMLVTGRQWWDFISFQPKQAAEYRLYIQRIPRDDEYIGKTLLPGLLAFWDDVQTAVERLRARKS